MKLFKNLTVKLTLSALIFTAGLVTLSTSASAATTPKNTPTITPKNYQEEPIYYGQEVEIRDGATYYESADLCGSGKSNVAPNHHIIGTTIVNGYTVLDKNNHPANHHYYPRTAIPANQPIPAAITSDLYLQICLAEGGTTGDIGWFFIGDLRIIRKSGHGTTKSLSDVVSTEAVIDEVNDLTADGKTALLLDASHSVDLYSQAIADYGSTVNNADVFVFAKDILKSTPESYAATRDQLDISKTDIYAALEQVSDYKNIVLVTDGLQNTTTRPNPESTPGKLSVYLVSPWLSENANSNIWLFDNQVYEEYQNSTLSCLKYYRTDFTSKYLLK